PASCKPALRPTRGSGDGAVTSGVVRSRLLCAMGPGAADIEPPEECMHPAMAIVATRADVASRTPARCEGTVMIKVRCGKEKRPRNDEERKNGVNRELLVLGARRRG